MDRQLGESREEAKYIENRAAAKCVEYFVDARDCDLRDLGDLVQFLVVDCDADAARHFWYAYQGTRPRESGMLDETGCNVGVENGVDLFRKDWVQSVRARLDRLRSWGNFNIEGSQGAFPVVMFGRGKDVGEFGESRREGVDGGGVPARSVQREVYASDVWGNSVQ